VGFFGLGQEDDSERRESLERVQNGGIPAGAQARLRALRTDGSLFTSGLSVNEFALLRQLGPRPLAQIMGASVVRTGWQYLPALEPAAAQMIYAGYRAGGVYSTADRWGNRIGEASPSQVRQYVRHTEVICELDILTDAWNLARRRALNRLREEALEVGADAVVGVHVHRGDRDLGRGTIDFVVTGTAIRLPNGTGTADPTLSDASVQEYWRLHSAGYEPAGLVAGTAVVFASPPRDARIRRARTVSRNQELEELSGAFHSARDTVRAMLLGQVADARGTGAVGVEFHHSVHREKLALASSIQTSDWRGWHRGRFGLPYRVSGHSDTERRGWVITMHAAGTAVRRRPGASQLAVKPTIRMGGR
jgi:uncharacterized protein YbjQ (UPF0145 family)